MLLNYYFLLVSLDVQVQTRRVFTLTLTCLPPNIKIVMIFKNFLKSIMNFKSCPEYNVTCDNIYISNFVSTFNPLKKDL